MNRPAQPELLSPVPFVRFAPDRRQIIASVAGALLLVLALAAAYSHCAAALPSPVARPLATGGWLALTLPLLAAIWEELRLWPAQAPFKWPSAAGDLVLYKSPAMAIIATLASLMVPLALAAVAAAGPRGCQPPNPRPGRRP